MEPRTCAGGTDTEGTDSLYNGTAANSHHIEGGGGNYQCLTSEPANFAFGRRREDAGYIYGTEFETWGNVPSSSLSLANQNVVCAVCYVSTRGAVVMIPGTYVCPAGWTREYYGYLMTQESPFVFRVCGPFPRHSTSYGGRRGERGRRRGSAAVSRGAQFPVPAVRGRKGGHVRRVQSLI